MSLEKASAGLATQYDKWSKKNLIKRIQELESGHLTPTEDNATPTAVSPAQKKRKFDFSKVNTRFVAFRFAYMGWNYNGLNYQYDPTPLPTVEGEILEAMTKAKLVPDTDPANSNFSRCGRTDKGVSALNQVISLDIRSSLSKEEQSNPENDAKEVPYLTILNAILPEDIRITAVCLRPPPNFDARFSCKYRHYKYLFKKEDMDIELMQLAASKYEGVHDFRNFCKIDGSKQITNHCREVYSAKIEHHDKDFYVFNLQGSAFLWHQVRCMVAILFLVGQKLEQPAIIDDLLDMSKYPSRPVYGMANDIPLVLYDCVYPEMEWLTSAHDFGGAQRQKLTKEYSRFNGTLLDYQLKAQIAAMVKDVYLENDAPLRTDENTGYGYVNIGDGIGRNYRNYLPIAKREVGDDVATVNARHKEKQKRKQQQKASEGTNA